MKVVNWRIVAHPINWVTILLMLIIAGVAGHYVMALFGTDTSAHSSQYSTKQTQ